MIAAVLVHNGFVQKRKDVEKDQGENIFERFLLEKFKTYEKNLMHSIIYKKDRQPAYVYGHFPHVLQVPFCILQNL